MERWWRWLGGGEGGEIMDVGEGGEIMDVGGVREE